MPELPEVETLRRGLERTIRNRRVTNVTVANGKVLKGQSEAAFRERTVGNYISHIERRGKYLLITLTSRGDAPTAIVPEAPSSPVILCIHLKMRGHIRIEEPTQEVGPYHCVTLHLEGTQGNESAVDGVELRFYDVWTWGEMRAFFPEELTTQVPALAEMGKEPLGPTAWGPDDLAAKLAGRRTAIKPTLLDQTVVAGVGNIYADEALFRAKINPNRPAKSLTGAETERLAGAVKTVLAEAVESGGTTSEDFFDVAGKPGRFHPLVYDRGGEPCTVCGAKLERIRLGGRGTVYCAICQPADR